MGPDDETREHLLGEIMGLSEKTATKEEELGMPGEPLVPVENFVMQHPDDGAADDPGDAELCEEVAQLLRHGQAVVEGF